MRSHLYYTCEKVKTADTQHSSCEICCTTTKFFYIPHLPLHSENNDFFPFFIFGFQCSEIKYYIYKMSTDIVLVQECLSLNNLKEFDIDWN
jgi:hypothetical protein